MYGFGWRSTLTPDLRLLVLANGDVRFLSGSGNASVFKKLTAPAFEAPYGMDADLVSVTGGYVLTDHLSQQKMTFNADGDLTKDADRNANSFDFSPDGHRLLSVTSNAGKSPGNKVNISHAGTNGRVNTITQAATSDTLARSVVYTYDSAGNGLETVTDADGKLTTFGYSGTDLISITDPVALTTFGYDGSHRVTSVTQSKLDGTNPETTEYDYATMGHVLVTDGEGNPAVDYEMDPFNATNNPLPGRIRSVTDAFGRKNTTEWDTAGTTKDKVTATVNSRGGRTEYTRGANGGQSLTKTVDPTGAESTATYALPEANRKHLPNTATPAGPMAAAQRKVTLDYNATGNPTTTSVGSASSTAVPNPDGTIARTFQPEQSGGANTRATQYAYVTSSADPGYRQLQTITAPTVAPADGTQPGPRSFSYDGNGRVKTSTDGNGVVTTYVYDRMDRVESMTFSNATPAVAAISRTYFGDGSLKTLIDGTGTTTFGYDHAGRMVSKSNNAGSLTYAFDNAGNMVSSTNTPAGGTSLVTAYGYNDANELDQLTEPMVAGELFAKIDVFGYNDLGLRSDTWYNTGAAPTYSGNTLNSPAQKTHLHTSYDNAGKVTGAKTTAYPGLLFPVATVLSDLSYSYTVDSPTACPGQDPGSITDTKQSVTDNLTGLKTSYCYKDTGQLTSASTPGGPAYSYGWDKNSNRTSDELGTHAYNDADQIKGVPAVTYDGAGNQKTSAAFSLISYNGINQTTSITPVGQAPLTFSYAGAGQADRTQAGSTTSQNGSLGLQVEKTGSATTTYVREPGGTLISQKLSTGDSFYYYFDGLGSVIGLVDGSGNQRAKYSYDPFGAHATETGVNGAAPANPWRWMGGYLDASSGLYHFGERYYEPARGRFLQMDPVDGGSASRYGYCSGDPVNCSDLNGLMDFWGRDGLEFINKWSGRAAAGAAFVTLVCPACIPISGGVAIFAKVVSVGSGVGMVTYDCLSKHRTNRCAGSMVDLGADAALSSIPARNVLGASGKYGPGAQIQKELNFGAELAGQVYSFARRQG
jgi:RHS repeat-associated protein